MENNSVSSYLAFSIDDEVFAIDVRSVIEVKDAQKLTKLPIRVKLVLGLMSYDDQYVPVIDSRTKFDFPAITQGSREVFIIAEMVKSDTEQLKLAFTADKVLGVMQIDSSKISEMPKMGVNNVDYVIGITKVNDKSYIILDIDKVFSVDEILLLEKTKLETV